MMRFALVMVGAALWCACGDNKAKTADAGVDAQLEGFSEPDLVCPGGPSCASQGDGVLQVGVAKRTWTPQNFETYTDENGDRQWQQSEPYTDLNGNHKFDGVWLFGGGRAALGVTTDVEARAMAFIEGDETFVIVYNDCIGMLAGDMDVIRNDPRARRRSNIDHIIIGSTHAHDAPDIVGLWGPIGRRHRARGRSWSMRSRKRTSRRSPRRSRPRCPRTMTIASTKLINDPTNPTSRRPTSGTRTSAIR